PTVAEQLLDERREPIDLGLRRRLVRTRLVRGRHAEVDGGRGDPSVRTGASVRPAAHAPAPTSVPTASGVLASYRPGGGSGRILLWEGCSGRRQRATAAAKRGGAVAGALGVAFWTAGVQQPADQAWTWHEHAV